MSESLNPGITTLEDLIGQEPPEHILEHCLIDSSYPGSNTLKYRVKGLPEVVVRSDRDLPEPAERETVAQAFQQLPAYGIDALPYIPVEHNGEVAVFTRRFHGDNLEDLLHPDIDPTLLRAIDHNRTHLIKYYTSGFADGEIRADDISSIDSYMYGRTAADPQEIRRLVLVDLGTYVTSYPAPLNDDRAFARILLDLANTLIEIEQRINKKGVLYMSRQACIGALAIANLSPERFSEHGHSMLSMTEDAVTNWIQRDPDREESLRDRIDPA